jgi:DNA-binding MarR family transcriptional regulator
MAKDKAVAQMLEEQAFLAILRGADSLQWQLAEMLKPYGLSPTQYNALRILRGAGKDGLPCQEIGERMINRDPDITRLMDRLEQRSLVQRSRDAADRRVIKARISSGGMKLLQSLDGEIERFHRDLMGHMGQRKLEQLIRLLQEAVPARERERQ